MTDALCVEGITRVARSFRRVISDGSDLPAREDMALASLFGGMALANAGLGAVHGFAGPIGGMFDAPHGAVCGVLLPHVLRTNLQAISTREPESPMVERFQKVAALLTQNPEAAPEEGIDWVRGFVAEVRLPSLSSYGVSESEIPELVSKASASSSMKANPLRLTNEELTAVLRAAL